MVRPETIKYKYVFEITSCGTKIITGESVDRFMAKNTMSIKKNTLWNLFGSAAPMLVGIPALPYIYNQIGIERVGVLTIIWALIGYFSIFDFGLGRAITQRIASFSSVQAESQITKTATTGVFLTLLLGVFGCAIGFVIINLIGIGWINSSEPIEQEVYSSFILACLAIPATTATAGLRGILEGEQHFKAVNLLKTALGLSNFLSPLASIALFGPRLDFIVGTLVLIRYMTLFGHCLIVKKRFRKISESLDINEFGQLFKFGGWITISNIISPLMSVADRFLVSNLLGAAVVAYYTIPAEFMMRLLIVPAAITTTLFPIFTKNFAEKENKNLLELYKNSLIVIFLVMGTIVACVLIGAGAGLKLWLGPVFAEKSTAVAIVLVVGILFNSLAQVPHAFIQASGDARATALIHLFESIFYLPTLLILTQMHGIVGTASAWTLRAFLDLFLLHIKAMQINR